jgi:hypothetical protein
MHNSLPGFSPLLRQKKWKVDCDFIYNVSLPDFSPFYNWTASLRQDFHKKENVSASRRFLAATQSPHQAGSLLQPARTAGFAKTCRTRAYRQVFL